MQRHEKFKLDQDHQDFAKSKILEINPSNTFEQFKDVFLLVGVIKSQGNELEFIYKTFEEFFAAKVFFEWIKKVPETNEQGYLLKVILMKPDYQLVRTFINLQLQRMTQQTTKDERQNALDGSLGNWGNIAAKLLNDKKMPLIGENGTPLSIAVEEGNKYIASFLLFSLKKHPDDLRKFLFTPEYTIYSGKFKGNALHLACRGDDVEIVRVLLDAAAGI